MKAEEKLVEGERTDGRVASAFAKMNSPPLSIRPAVAADAGLLNTLIREFASFERSPTTITEDALLRDGFGPKAYFQALIAEWENRPAGYALFFDYYASFRGRCLFLEDIYVRDQYRGKGIGKALFAQLAAIAQEKECASIMFNVMDWNTGAMNVYRGLGATFLDDWKVLCLEGNALQTLARSADQASRS